MQEIGNANFREKEAIAFKAKRDSSRRIRGI